MTIVANEALRRIRHLATTFEEPEATRPLWLDRIRNAATGTLRRPRSVREEVDIADMEAGERAIGARSLGQHGFTARVEDLGIGTRALTVGDSAQGGYLVDSPNLMYMPYPQPASQVVDLVEHMVLPFGAGNPSIPTGASSLAPTYQGAETAQVTDSTLSTGQQASTPHTLICTVSFSRLLNLQSTPAINGVVNAELSRALRAAVSAGILAGDGTNGQPHGIVGLAGIGSESGASIALSNVVTSQQTIGDANAIFDPASVGYFASPDTAATMMQRFTSPQVEPLWRGDLFTGMVAGVKGFATKSMPASTLLLGDWSTVLLVIWGGVEILVDPFQGPSGSNFKVGLITVRLAFTYDVICRYPVSFYSLTGIS
jgi:HK97 family phage major capsid protein